MYTEESMIKLLEVLKDKMEFEDLSLTEYNETERIYNKLREDLRK